jgi:acetyl esterase/lipase
MSRRVLFAQGCFLLVAAVGAASVGAQPPQESRAESAVELLWPSGAPGAVGNEDVDKPSLTLYLPEGGPSTGIGVVVCPGGGYARLAMDHEGKQIAQWLNSIGIAAFVLKYRLGPRYHHPAQMLDAQRAVRMVRANAPEFRVNPNDIGIWGFSAGGHLASTVATHFDPGDPQAADPIDGVSCRPDFAILAYPVISFTTEYTHRGSLEHLLGKNPDPKLVEFLSNEKQVTPDTPPTFLFHTDADDVVPPENSVLYYLALRKAGVPAEMHIFQHGPHGVGLAPTDQVLSLWSDCLANWLKARSWERLPR